MPLCSRTKPIIRIRDIDLCRPFPVLCVLIFNTVEFVFNLHLYVGRAHVIFGPGIRSDCFAYCLWRQDDSGDIYEHNLNIGSKLTAAVKKIIILEKVEREKMNTRRGAITTLFPQAFATSDDCIKVCS